MILRFFSDSNLVAAAADLEDLGVGYEPQSYNSIIVIGDDDYYENKDAVDSIASENGADVESQ